MVTDASGRRVNNNVGVIGKPYMLMLSIQSNMGIILEILIMCGDIRSEDGQSCKWLRICRASAGLLLRGVTIGFSISGLLVFRWDSPDPHDRLQLKAGQRTLSNMCRYGVRSSIGANRGFSIYEE
jgi:hypothetical protein